MTDLRLVAVTPERSHLVLEDDESNQFRVPMDERLDAALGFSRSDRSRAGASQLEIALEPQLTPRDIQARIRAGHSTEDVASAAGVSVARIARYAGPVLAEREHVAQLARQAPARRASGGSAPPLAEVVEARFEQQSVAADSVHWDAWRSEEDRWTVELCYLAEARERRARWTFDPRGRVLAPADDEARWISEDSRDERRAAPVETAPRMRRLASVPKVAAGTGAPAPAPDSDAVYDREADEPVDPVPARRPDAAEEASVAAGGGSGPAPARHASRPSRRPSVPSWDDIMFGTRRRD
jgi:hypothetical protein